MSDDKKYWNKLVVGKIPLNNHYYLLLSPVYAKNKINGSQYWETQSSSETRGKGEKQKEGND